jgi:hypothetical protein
VYHTADATLRLFHAIDRNRERRTSRHRFDRSTGQQPARSFAMTPPCWRFPSGDRPAIARVLTWRSRKAPCRGLNTRRKTNASDLKPGTATSQRWRTDCTVLTCRPS